MVAVPRCLRATRVRLLRRAPAPHGIARWRQAARHHDASGLAARRSAARRSSQHGRDLSRESTPHVRRARLLRAADGPHHCGEAGASGRRRR